jgi:hypothetical protein
MAANDTVPALHAQLRSAFLVRRTFSRRATVLPARLSMCKSPPGGARLGGRALRSRDSSSNQSTRLYPAARTSPNFPQGRITLRRTLQWLPCEGSRGTLEIIRRPLACAGSRDLEPNSCPIRHMDALWELDRILFHYARDTHSDSVTAGLPAATNSHSQSSGNRLSAPPLPPPPPASSGYRHRVRPGRSPAGMRARRNRTAAHAPRNRPAPARHPHATAGRS